MSFENNLHIVDKYPKEGASGVYINDIVWVQFSEPVASGTVTYYNFTVNERNTYDPVDGTPEVHGISGFINDAIAVFVPTTGFKRNTEYSVLVSSAIKAKTDNRYLDSDVTWYFKTGSTASSGTVGSSVYHLDPSGFTASGTTSTGPDSSGTQNNPLEILDTYPTDHATDIPTDLGYIKLVFNAPIPSGINLYEFIDITSKSCLA